MPSLSSLWHGSIAGQEKQVSVREKPEETEVVHLGGTHQQRSTQLSGKLVFRTVPAAIPIRAAGGGCGSCRLLFPAPGAGKRRDRLGLHSGRVPICLGRFFQYNGMNLEQFLLAFFRSEFLTPKRLVFKSENIYAKLMEHTSMKEALKLD